MCRHIEYLMIFWLKNRRKEEWRDKTDVEHAGENQDGHCSLHTQRRKHQAGEQA